MAATSIGKLAVSLSADTRQFTAGMSGSATMIGRVQSAVGRATDTVRTWDAVTASAKGFKLAGADTLDSFRVTLAVARSELRRFNRTADGRPVVLRALNAAKLPAQAALATLAPMRRLAVRGVTVALRASHHGIAVTVAKARAMLTRFSSFAGSALGPAAIAGGTLTAGIGGLGVYAVKLAADAEQAQVAFTTMLGSADAAKALLVEINGFAATTPFQTPELIDASKKLLAFGIAGDQVIPTMRSLGDLAAGLNVPIGDLSEIFGKARVQGRLMAEDINQLTGRGIPVIGEFAKQFGVAESEVKGLVESGQIGFPHLQQAIVSMTGEGGKFAGLMAAQSQTVGGLFSTMQDTAVLALTRLGQSITEKLDVRGAIGGISNAIGTLSSAALPVIDAFIGRMAEGGNIGQRAGEFVLNGAELIATGLAHAIDYSKLVVAGFRTMQSGAAYAIGGVLTALDYLGAGLVKLLNYLPGVSLEWDATIGAMGQAVLDEAGTLADAAGVAFEDFQNGGSAKGVGRFFDDVRSKAAASASQINASGDAMVETMKIAEGQAGKAGAVLNAMETLRADAASVGMGDGTDKIAGLTKLGATPEQIAQARELIDLKGRLEGFAKIGSADPTGDYAAAMQGLQSLYAAGKVTADQFATIRAAAQTSLNDTLTDQAKQLTEGLRTSLESYQSEIERLNELFERNLISKETLDRATAKARDTMSKAGGEEPGKPVAAIRAGSQEAIRYAFDSARGPSKLGSPGDYAKAQLKETEKHGKTLDAIARNTERATTNGTPLEVVDL